MFEDLRFTAASLTSCVVILMNFYQSDRWRIASWHDFNLPFPKYDWEWTSSLLFQGHFYIRFCEFFTRTFCSLVQSIFWWFLPLILRLLHILETLTLYICHMVQAFVPCVAVTFSFIYGGCLLVAAKQCFNIYIVKVINTFSCCLWILSHR